jgi:hypothetical protein
MVDVSCRRRFSGGLLLTYRNAADTSDIQQAIGNLSELATQTKRQADNTHEQLGAVRDQVSALKDQAEEAKLQTAAIAKQTEAIKASSDAAIRSAEATSSAARAQQKMAEVTAQAHKPDVSLVELTVNGLNDEPDKDGLVHPTILWRFQDTGAPLQSKTLFSVYAQVRLCLRKCQQASASMAPASWSQTAAQALYPRKSPFPSIYLKTFATH